MYIKYHHICFGVIFAIIGVCLSVSIAHAATYYTATTGSDSNGGSIGSPFRTVQHGVNALSAGDTLYIRGGTYTEHVARSGMAGTAQNPIVISSYPGETATIDADHTSITILIENASYVTVQNLIAINGDHVGAGDGRGYNTVFVGDSNNIRIDNLEVYGTNGYCDGGSAQIQLHYSTYVTVENNRVHDSNFQPHSGNYNCGGIGMMGSYGGGLGNITIQNNTVYNMPIGTAIWDKHPGYGTIEIAYNTIYHVHNASFIRQRNVHFHHNRIYDITNTETDPTIRIFNETPDPVNTNIHVEYNTIASCPYAAIWYSSGTNITLNNNIYYQCTQPSGEKRTLTICEYGSNCASGSGIAQISSNNNCIYYTPTSNQYLRYNGATYSLQQARTNYSLDVNSVFVNPQFLSTDPNNTNFLKPSPGNSCEAMGYFSASAAPSCTESWTCSAWSACTNSQQTRTCTDTNACGTVYDKPAESQACQASPSCTESWTCSAWSACTNSQQTRTCADTNACGTTIDQPVTAYACTSGSNELVRTGDVVNPNTRITAGPASLITTSRGNIQWSGVDDKTDVVALTYSYQLDNRSWSDWTSSTAINIGQLSNGTHAFSVRSRDAAGNVDGTPATITFAVQVTPYIITGPRAGGRPQVRIFDVWGKVVSAFMAFETSFKGGINVAMGDVSGDGTDEIIVGSGPGRRPEVRIFRRNGTLITSFLAFSSGFRGGVNIATGDIDGDGSEEIIATPQSNSGPQVKVFGFRNGKVVSLYNIFWAYDKKFRGGVSIGTADVDGDLINEIVTAPLSKGGPHLRVFKLQGNTFREVARSIMAYASGFRGGVLVAGGNVKVGGASEILTGIASKGTAHVRMFGLSNGALRLVSSGFIAFTSSYRGGVGVAAADVNTDGLDEIVVAVNGNGRPWVKIFSATGRLMRQFFAYSTTFRQGLTVATGE